MGLKKKFKVRVVLFDQQRYCVQYAYYYFIPVYHTLKFWFFLSYTGSIHTWATKLFSVKEAEQFASTLKSIEDIRKYYIPQEAKQTEFYKERKASYKKNVPYRTKNF
jgi:hypothetical protein